MCEMAHLFEGLEGSRDGLERGVLESRAQRSKIFRYGYLLARECEAEFVVHREELCVFRSDYGLKGERGRTLEAQISRGNFFKKFLQQNGA